MTALLTLAVIVLTLVFLSRLSGLERRLTELKREVERLRAALRAEREVAEPARPVAAEPAPPPPVVTKPPAPVAVPPKPAAPSPPAAPPKPVTPPPVAERPRPTVPAPRVAPVSAAQAPSPAPARPRTPVKERPKIEWESLLGANWLAKLGVAALAVAAGFFLKYAFEEGWIGPQARVAIGVCAAGVLVGLSQYLLRKPLYRNYAQVLFSGGIVIFFLSIYAGSNYYHVINFTLAFALLAVAAVAASALAAANKAQPVALLCLLGAFMTPVLLQEEGVGSSNLVRLYVYLAGLNVWSAVLARYSAWPSLTAMSFGATWLLFIGAGPGRKPDVFAAEAFAVVFLAFGCYGSLSTARGPERPRPEMQALSVVMLIGGCLAFVIASVRLMAGVFVMGLPGLAIPGVLVALVLASMASTFPRLPEGDLELRQLLRYLSTAAVLLLIAVTVAAGPPTPQAQAPAAFAFVLFTYGLFLAAAVHMQRQEAGVVPAAALLFANIVAHLVATFRVLAAVQVWGIDAAPLWLPIASCLCLASLWAVARSDSAPYYFRKAVMLGSHAMLLAPLFSLAAFPLSRLWSPGTAAAVFFVEFVLVSGAWVALRRATIVPHYRGDLVAAFANATIFFALLAAVVHHAAADLVSPLAICACALAAYHGLVGAGVLRRADDDSLRRAVYLAIGLTFATIAIPLQLKGSAITVAWAIEAAALVLVGVTARSLWTRWYGVVVLLMAAARALAVDLNLSQAPPVFLNQRMLSGLAVIAAAYVASWLMARRRERLSENERSLPALFLLIGTAYLVIFPSVELWLLAGREWSPAGRLSAQNFALTLYWSVFAVVALVVGLRRRSIPVRGFALALLSIAGVKALMLDLTLNPSPFHLLLNTRLLSGAAATAALGISAWLLARGRSAAEEWERPLPTALMIVANVVPLIFVSFDLWLYLGMVVHPAGRASAQLLSLSLFWGAFAAAALAVGIWRRDVALRSFGLCLLGLAIGKVVLVDLVTSPDSFRLLLNTRFLSGAGVIAATSVSAWMLARWRTAVHKSEAALAPTLIVTANVLALLYVSLDLWVHIGSVVQSAGRPGAQHLALSLFWSGFGVVALAAGIRSRNLALRSFALLLLLLATAKIAVIDLMQNPVPFQLFNNTRFLAGLAVMVGVSGAAWLISRKRNDVSESETAAMPALVLTPNLLALMFVSVDIWQYFGTALPGAAGASAQQLSLSIFWSVYASVGLSVGIWRGSRPVRLVAMGLLYLSILKVFVFDLSFLEQPYRIVSFLGLGLLLLLVSLLYTRFEGRGREESRRMPADSSR